MGHSFFSTEQDIMHRVNPNSYSLSDTAWSFYEFYRKSPKSCDCSEDDL